MAHRPVLKHTISIEVTEKVLTQLNTLAKEGGIKTTTLCGFLFDAAYAARVKVCFDADLDAQVALVGLATMAKKDLAGIAEAAGLSIETANRMRDGWKAVLLERRRGR